MTFAVYWVEDELERLEATKNKLQASGAEIIHLRDAQQARESVGEIEYRRGIIILDLHLPESNRVNKVKLLNPAAGGLEILKDFQKKLGKDWPIFILSGNLSVDLVDELVDLYLLPENRIFAKPIDRDKFVLAVSDLNAEWSVDIC